MLDAAAIEFGRSGFETASVHDIAARAKISRPLIFAYFGSKEELYCRCLERVGEALIRSIEGALATPKAPLDAAGEVLDAIFVALEDRPSDWNIVYGHSLPAGSRAKELAAHYRAKIAEQAARGVGASTQSSNLSNLDDVELLTQIWMSSVSTMMRWWSRHPDRTSVEMMERSRRLITTITTANLGLPAV